MSLQKRGFDQLRRFVHNVAGRTPPAQPKARTMVPVPGGAFVFDIEGGTRFGADSYTPGSAYSRLPTTFSMGRPFGRSAITDQELDFLVKREPVVHWTVWYVAQDIFDNKLRVYIEGRKEDDAFDQAVQKAFLELKAYSVLARSTAFERLYGTSVILCSYQGSDSWDSSIYEDNGDLKAGLKLLLLSSYPWSQVNVVSYDTVEASIRFGKPLIYEIDRGDGSPLKVHWSKIIHDAPRLFDDPVEGMSIVQILYDDATGFRNMRWGLYQTIFRYGSGFPHIHLPGATRAEINAMINAGEFDYINSRGFFVTGGKGDLKEELTFKGVQGVSLDPTPYMNMSFESFSLASRIPQDIFKGVSAGRITGSEFNERNYYKYISSEQNAKSPVVRELVDRLLATGQIEPADGRVKFPPDSEYVVEWYSAFELNDVDKTRIRLWESTTYKNFGSFMMVDEIRELNKLKPLADDKGQVVLELRRLDVQAMKGAAQVRSGQTQPKEGEPQGNRPEER